LPAFLTWPLDVCSVQPSLPAVSRESMRIFRKNSPAMSQP